MRKVFTLILALLFVACTATGVSANSAEPPGIIVLVPDAPADMTLTLELQTEPEYGVRIQESSQGWETYFRIYFPPEPGLLDGAVLHIHGAGKTFSCALPARAALRYNTLLTLSFQEETLTFGQQWWRQPLLTAIRVTLTLLVEGLIFFLAGFRSKRSWILFLTANLVTQGWLNIIINSSAFSNGYWLLGLYLAEAVIFLGESIFFPLAIREKKKWICALVALGANTASLIVGLLLINLLPI